jgi:hypothetical protein
MLCFKDTTFCASPNCNNQCGHKITEQEREKSKRLNMIISVAYFCDIPEKIYQSLKINEIKE